LVWEQMILPYDFLSRHRHVCAVEELKLMVKVVFCRQVSHL
jgi:hypothetical protein